MYGRVPASGGSSGHRAARLLCDGGMPVGPGRRIESSVMSKPDELLVNISAKVESENTNQMSLTVVVGGTVITGRLAPERVWRERVSEVLKDSSRLGPFADVFGGSRGEGPPDGRAEGPPDGLAEGPSAGLAEGPLDGLAEGPLDGLAEGPLDGLAEGPSASLAEGPSDGLAEGPSDGRTESPSEGRAEGSSGRRGEGPPEQAGGAGVAPTHLHFHLARILQGNVGIPETGGMYRVAIADVSAWTVGDFSYSDQ